MPPTFVIDTERRYGENASWQHQHHTRHPSADTAIEPFERDAPGRKQKHSPILGIEQKAAIVAFRRHTLPPLEVCLFALSRASPFDPPFVASLLTPPR